MVKFMSEDKKFEKLLTDDELDQVSGGLERDVYTVNDMKKAGINVVEKNGKMTYQTKLSNGQTIMLSKNAANSAVDCYKLSGGIRLNDSQLKDLIAQS